MEPFIHAILWLLYIAGEVISLAMVTGSYSPISHYICFYLLNILLFYSYVRLLFRIPESSPLPLLWTVLIFMCMMVLYVGLAGMLTNVLGGGAYKSNPIEVFNKKFLVLTIWRGFYFMLFGTGYVAIKMSYRRRIAALDRAAENARLKQELMLTEKAFLRSQINPHFLFNTLSFINHATKHHPENARTAIAMLSDIMDYALESSKGEFVLLSDEVEQIENMITLNRLRFGEKLNLVFEKNLDCGQVSIIPLILLTLVENVFKHGNLLHKTETTFIKIFCAEKSISFTTSNPLDPGKNSRGSQTGLKNIMARLFNSYPKKHLFVSGTDGERFKAELTINL